MVNYKEELRKYQEIIVQNYDKFWTKRFMEEQGKPHRFRKIGVNEVVWDIDHVSKELSHKICDFISSKLCKDKISHGIFQTPRTHHIHSFFDEMVTYPKDFRRKLREEIVKHYSGEYYFFMDSGLFSENKTIRDFNAPHEKVNGCKSLIYVAEYSSPNKIPIEILKKVKSKFNKKDDYKTTNINIYNKDYKEILDKILNHEGIFPIGSRNNILLKNIVAMVINIPEPERLKIYKKVLEKCPDMKISEFFQWEKWFVKRIEQGIKPYYNQKEVENAIILH